MSNEELVTVTYRLPKKVVDAIRERAEEEDRSMNNMVKIILIKCFAL